MAVSTKDVFVFGADPYHMNYLLQFADLPPTVADVDGSRCIVEGIISRGRQCTLEGYVHNHRVSAYGVVDMWRVYEDALVESVPDRNAINSLEKRFPGAEIQLHIESGMRLSDLPDQDSYSYEIAVVFLGGASQPDLLQQYSSLQKALAIRLQPLPDDTKKQLHTEAQ